MSEMENKFVLLDGDEPPQLPLAGCGYDIWRASLAHMGVLTAPGLRRQGHAATAVSVAVGEAMDVAVKDPQRDFWGLNSFPFTGILV
ncbi:hypothetical protein LOC59_08170 [Arthrobacter sp. zg-Y916]|uniref:hypothetical protein n=1 Tax=Arthrobacter sp. zg-Y916 TaxID=2894190 RepID=UPI001E376A40|nr:hypothetical protein [Arthrobacter sp. zg-Y916]MCC9193624.1 hypothetical protein [Arthrobacter sp. zg-Y916]